MNILVTGATGNFGGYALKVLQDLVPEDNLYGLARTEEKGAKLKEAGFKVRIGDYTDSASLQKAFEGIDRLLFVSSTTDGDRQAQHRDVVEAAKAAGVGYIAYTSFGKATESTSPLAADHRFTEQLIEESGIAHTFLRNNWYLENEAAFLAAGAKGGKFIYAGGNGQAGWALRREYAEVAARAVSGKFDFPKILELGGSLRTYEDLGAALRGATGKDLEVINVVISGIWSTGASVWTFTSCTGRWRMSSVARRMPIERNNWYLENSGLLPKFIYSGYGIIGTLETPKLRRRFLAGGSLRYGR